MATGLKDILNDLQKGMNPNGIYQRRRRQTRVPAVEAALNSIAEQFLLMSAFNPASGYVGSSPERVKNAIADYGHIIEGLNNVGRLLTILRQGRIETGNGEIFKFKRPWPKGRKQVPHFEQYRRLQQRVREALEPAKHYLRTFEKRKTEVGNAFSAEIKQAQAIEAKAAADFQKLEKVYGELYFGLEKYAHMRWLKNTAEILGTSENLADVLKRIEQLERDTRSSADDAVFRFRYLKKRLEERSEMLPEAQIEESSKMLSSALEGIIEKYELGQKTWIDGGITIASVDTIALMEAVKTVGELEKLTGKTKMYLDLLDKVYENLCEGKLEAPENIAEHAFNIDAVAEVLEEKLAILKPHDGAHLYFSNELDKIRNIPNIVREIQAEYDSECSKLRTKANAYAKKTIETSEDLRYAMRDIEGLLEKIEKIRGFTGGGLIKPKPVVKDATYQGLKDFLSVLQRTSIALQRGSSRSEYAWFVQLINDAEREREEYGIEDNDYQDYVREAGRHLKMARELIEMRGEIDKRVAPLFKDDFTEKDFNQGLINKYIGWSQELGRKQKRSKYRL
ncbi:hypothetical protein KY325_03775 [Candidatus Woesearchaeota archaeon]|nr:hypothetical protein [Candidatus Woesearchaeota archaeon]MBW3018252.1 hypothetical protein [Candidatus Woesearchaeota archaeon]